jgi:pimeloyl-ACP methyl ester carboxylesterase
VRAEILQLHDATRPSWTDTGPRQIRVHLWRPDADDRVLAGFLICPAVAELLVEESLAALERPVEVRRAAADDIAPPPENAEVYARLIPSAEGHSVGPEVGHYAFLADNPEFAEVREQVASEAVAFFDARLG